MTLLQWLTYVVAVGGFWGVWYLVGAWAGILWTRRGLAPEGDGLRLFRNAVEVFQ